MDYLRNFTLSNSSLFLNKDNQSTIKHISRFTMQCKKTATNDICYSLSSKSSIHLVHKPTIEFCSHLVRNRTKVLQTILHDLTQSVHGWPIPPILMRRRINWKLHDLIQGSQKQMSFGHPEVKVRQDSTR